MTTAHDIDLPAVLADRLTSTHPDVLRELLTMFLHTLMGAEADALCGAGYGERSADRTNQRNGYRHRQFDTRTGSLDLAIPKLRNGSYFPDWLLERRKRAERALTTVVATCYLLGVSTRRMDKLVETLGITSLSKSQVSVMAKENRAAAPALCDLREKSVASVARGSFNRLFCSRGQRAHIGCAKGKIDIVLCGKFLHEDGVDPARSATQPVIQMADDQFVVAAFDQPVQQSN